MASAQATFGDGHFSLQAFRLTCVLKLRSGISLSGSAECTKVLVMGLLGMFSATIFYNARHPEIVL
jgi:hypothetical protein